MLFLILIQSLFIGIAVAAPLGPMGLLCIRSAITGGWRMGLIAGLGVAAADACYAAIAGLGVTAISSQLIQYEDSFRIIGGLFIVLLGLAGFRRSHTTKVPKTDQDAGQVFAFTSTFLLTLANPMTIISFTALAAGMGTRPLTSSWEDAGAFTTGIFLGSALWWLLLASAVHLFRTRFLTPLAVRAVDLASASIITGIGVWTLINGL